MNTTKKPQAGEHGLYEFTMQVDGRELTCHADKKGDRISVKIDNNMSAELEVHWDNTVTQLSGNLPDSQIEFIKKHVLEHGK